MKFEKKRLALVVFILIEIFAFAFSYQQKNSGVPQRIVSLTPSGTEILFELGVGNRLIARTDFCNFPAEALNIPSVGGFDGSSISIEKILENKPDFVYLTAGMHDFLIPQLKAFGIRYYLSDASSIEGIYDEIIEVGKIMGVSDAAKNIVQKMNNELKALSSKTSVNSRKKIYIEIYFSPYISAGNLSYLNDVVNVAGFNNIFADINSAYPQVSEEQIIVRNPDVIIATDYSNFQIDEIYQRNGWNEISAIKNKNVFSVNGDIFSRPGPRVVEAVKFLQELVNVTE